MLKKILHTAVPAIVVVLIFAFSAHAQGVDETIEVSVSRAKVERGGSVEVTIRSSGPEPVHAVLLKPTKGVEPLTLEKAAGSSREYRAGIGIGQEVPAGLYVVHAWTGERSNPSSVGKGTFRVGNIVADFFVANYLEKDKPEDDLSKYLADFRAA